VSGGGELMGELQLKNCEKGDKSRKFLTNDKKYISLSFSFLKNSRLEMKKRT